MRLNKSTGFDGLTVEFYRTFWSKIEHLPRLKKALIQDNYPLRKRKV